MSMTLISTVTVGAGGTSSIAFNSIPATGTDLLIYYSIRTNSGTTRLSLPLSFNSTTTTYVYRDLYGTDSVTGSGTGNRYTIAVNGDTSTSGTFSNGSLYIPNYTSSVAKIYSVDAVAENNATAGFNSIVSGSWSGTSAISSVLIDGDGATILQYSTASLYTITKGSGGADLPVLFYDFVSSTQGWGGNSVSLSTSGGILSTNPIGNDPYITSPSISISGSLARYIKVTFKKATTTQSTTWDGSVFYSTSSHGYDGNYRMAFNEPTWDGNYKTLVFDMHNLTFGGADWQNSTITSIRIDFSNAQSDGNFLIDSISLLTTV